MTILNKFQKIFNKYNGNDPNVIYKNSTSKYSVTAECIMEFSSKTDEKKGEINSHLKAIVKKYINNPEKLIQYISFHGVKVYKFNNADKILSYFDEEEGFILPQKGLKALILNVIIAILTGNKLKISFSTPEMLIFNINTEVYTIIRALHKYYSFKNKMPGFDAVSQSMFKKIYAGKNSGYRKNRINNMSLNDIFSCREALARDLDSINFTLQMSLEYERSKKVLNKILKEKNTNI